VPTTVTIRKAMQCALTQDELLARLEEHRATVNALRELDEERKFLMRQLNERKKRLQAEEVRLDSICNQKWENRDVECLVEFHKPVVGQKTTVRTDTGEIVSVEDMTEDEKQERLFEEKAEFERVVGDIPLVSPYEKTNEGDPEKTKDLTPASEIRITEVPTEEVVQQTPTPEIVGQCLNCSKDVPEFALDEGKCAFCENPLPKCETCGGYLYAEGVMHSLEAGECGPRPADSDEATHV
jgi:hypothetical protein